MSNITSVDLEIEVPLTDLAKLETQTGFSDWLSETYGDDYDHMLFFYDVEGTHEISYTTGTYMDKKHNDISDVAVYVTKSDEPAVFERMSKEGKEALNQYVLNQHRDVITNDLLEALQ